MDALQTPRPDVTLEDVERVLAVGRLLLSVLTPAEIDQLRDCLEKQRLQYEQFRLKSSEFLHKTEQKEWNNTLSAILPDMISQDLCDEEIEFELLQRKEAVKGGVHT